VLEWSQRDRLQLALEEGVSAVSLFWGDPSPYLDQIREGRRRAALPPAHGPARGRKTPLVPTAPIVRYRIDDPRPDMSGDIEALALHAGQSAGLVHEILPAGDIVRIIANEAEAVLRHLTGDRVRSEHVKLPRIAPRVRLLERRLTRVERHVFQAVELDVHRANEAPQTQARMNLLRRNELG
jgi:hypothetical protein